jgi:hypothetical protein
MLGRPGHHPANDVGMFDPVKYVIVVQGTLEHSWSERLGGMVIMVREAADGSQTTLSGVLPDQTALQGVLKSLYDLGLPVLSVTSA